MNYTIIGGNLPVVELSLSAGESVHCEAGSMSWMSDNMKMETSGGGLGKMLTKAMTHESMFRNTYTAIGGEGMIAFASSFPGSIVAVPVEPGRDVICQKSAFLAAAGNVEMHIFFQKKLGAGLFGGEGFIMQRYSGSGIVFIEIDGSSVEKYLAPGERLVIDTGYLAMMDASCTMEIESVKGFKNVLLGGEGLFNTVVTGPGRVVLQSMPASNFAAAISPYIMKKND